MTCENTSGGATKVSDSSDGRGMGGVSIDVVGEGMRQGLRSPFAVPLCIRSGTRSSRSSRKPLHSNSFISRSNFPLSSTPPLVI